MRELWCGVVLSMLAWCSAAGGQAIRVGTPKKPGLTGSGTLTLSVSPSTASITLQQQSVGFATVNLTTAWSGSTTGALQIYAYFASTNALATSNGLATIPTADVLAYVPSGGLTGSYVAFTQSTPVAGSSVEIVAQSSQTLTTGSRTDAVNILIALYNPQQAAGKYTGVVYFEGQEY